MEAYSNYYLLGNSDIGYPRFTTARRKLETYREAVYEIFPKMFDEFGIENRPENIFVGFMLNKVSLINTKKSSAGFFVSSTCGKVFYIYLSLFHAIHFHDETLDNTVPHEVCHGIHRQIDHDTFVTDGHGKDFEDLLEICAKVTHMNPKNGFFIPAVDFEAHISHLKDYTETWIK